MHRPLLILADCLRQATRGITRSRAFSLSVVAILALGLAFSSSISSLANALLVKPVSASNPEHLVAISLADADGRRRSMTAPTLTRFAAHPVFAVTAPYSSGGVLNCRIGSELVKATIEAVGASYFDLLQRRPLVGRTFQTADEVVLGHRFWQRHFASNRSSMGETLIVDDRAMTIVGVMPKAVGLQVDIAPDLFIPIEALAALLGGPPSAPVRSGHLIGRVRDDVTVEAAVEELRAAWPAVASQLTVAEGRDARLVVESIETGFSTLRTRYSRPLLMLLLLSLALLAIACINATGLFFVRQSIRANEIAVRMVVGGSYGRIALMLLIESGLLVAASMAVALPLAWLSSRVLLATVWAAGTVPTTLDVTPDRSVWLGIAAAGVLMTLVTGGLPILLMRRRRSLTGRASRTTTAAFDRLGKGLLVAQLALTVALIFAASLVGRSLLMLRHIELGFDTEGIIFSRLVEQPGGYKNLDSNTYYPELLSRVSALPGVSAVALSRAFPAALIDRQHVQSSEGAASGVRQVVSPGFFATVGMSVLSGRDFSERDADDAPRVAIVTRSLARALFGDDSAAVGRRLRLGEGTAPEVDVIGVVSDARFGSLRQSETRGIFLPAAQTPRFLAPIILVKSDLPLSVMAPAIDRTIQAMGREYPVRIVSIAQNIDMQFTAERLLAWLATVFAVASSTLVVVGVVVLFSFAVQQRRRELGIRVALGATPKTILLSVVRTCGALAVAGFALGIPLALIGARLLNQFLYEVHTLDVAAVVVTGLSIPALAIAGAWMPARRASHVDPAEVLRSN